VNYDFVVDTFLGHDMSEIQVWTLDTVQGDFSLKLKKRNIFESLSTHCITSLLSFKLGFKPNKWSLVYVCVLIRF